MNNILIPKNVYSMPTIEYRSMPSLLEQRNNLLTEMDNYINSAKAETRSMSEEETNKFNAAKTEVEKIDATLQAEEQAKKLNDGQTKTQTTKAPEQEEKRALDETNLIKFIKGEERALDVAGNGGIIPETIAARIIERVKELSPIYARSTVFNVGGDLIFPKFDPSTIQTAYVADMTQLTATNGNFTTIKLSNFIAGALTQVSRSLLNRTNFDLVAYIVNRMAMSIASFLERELLIGAGGTTAATGIFVDSEVTPVVAGSATAITLDDLITTQMQVPEIFQPDACWIMHKNIFTGIRKLKGTDGYPLLNQDVTQGFGWTLLGKPVFISENAPATMATGLNALAYGDMAGNYVKLSQDVEIQVLNELFATQHATGVVGYIEFDSRVVEPQRITRLRMA